MFGWCRASYPADRGLFIAFTALIRASGVNNHTITITIFEIITTFLTFGPKVDVE